MIKRRFLWAVWLLAAALLWLFENNAATLSILAASVLLPLLSLLAARRGGEKARLELAAEPRGAKGKPAEVFLAASGAGFFSRVSGRLRCANGLTGEEAETSFSFSGRGKLGLAADTAHCGTLRLSADARTEDLFGLFRANKPDCEDVFVTIEPELFLPRVELEENTTVISDSEVYSQTKPGSDPSETFGIREYQPGDPIRQIHWKLSQKSDALLLRELGLPVVNKTLLVFRNALAEGEKVSPASADAMAEVFLSISHALVNDGLAHTAAFAEGGQYLLTEVQNEGDFRSMEERFLTLSWEEDDGALARLLAETPYAHVGVVSADVPPDAENYCRGNRVSIFTGDASSEAAGVFVVPFTLEDYRNELKYIEL